MNIFSLGKTALAYELTEPLGKKQNIIDGNENNIIFIHGGIIADANVPLLTRSDILIKNYNILHYHRRGYGYSSHKYTDITIEEQAKDCKMLLDALKIKKSHILGHSIGGAIAIEFSHKYKQYVKSLILLEPAITGYNEYTNSNVIKEFESLIEKYDNGFRDDVIKSFMKSTIGNNFKNIIEKVLPVNTFKLSVIDADIFFHDEIKAMKLWNFTEKQTKRLADIPVLHIYGKRKGNNRSEERNRLLLKLLQNTNSISIKEAPHMLQITNYHEVNKIIGSFLK
jgi:pimeloyl-ACP methyl ester carboxylesterase